MGIGNWVAFVDEISEGFASPLDLVEYLVCGANSGMGWPNLESRLPRRL